MHIVSKVYAYYLDSLYKEVIFVKSRVAYGIKNFIACF